MVRSRWTRRFRQKGPRPRFKTGDVAGKFTVAEYFGYTSVKPVGEPAVLSQEHHWYGVVCECGNKEIHTQQQLIDRRRHRACEECISKIMTGANDADTSE